jgi:hypothetical protein
MSYEGSERRVHHVFVTRNTEYHVRAEVCVAVRDRTNDRWRDDHPAVGRRLAGALKHVHGGIIPTLERPARDVVAAYPCPLH